jgi:hypothetical protein
MIETNIPLSLLLKNVFIPSYKRCIKWYNDKKAKLLIIPYDSLKKKVLKFLIDNNYAVIDLDHPEAYILASDDEDISRFTSNKINLKRLVRRLKEYTLNELKDDCNFVIYICSSFDYCDLFNSTNIYTLIPSSVYLAINELERNELFELKAQTTHNIKKKNRLSFSTEEEVLVLISRRLCNVR